MVTGSRDTTTVATQALYLLNDPFVRRQSLALAERLLARTDLDDAGRVDLAYRLALGPAGRRARRSSGRGHYLARLSRPTGASRSRRRPSRRSPSRAVTVAADAAEPTPQAAAAGRTRTRSIQVGRAGRARRSIRASDAADRRLGQLLPGAARLGRVPLRQVIRRPAIVPFDRSQQPSIRG